MSIRKACLIALSLTLAPLVFAADRPAPTEGDFVLRDFRFEDGEVLPELKLHYANLGSPVRDASGVVRNAVLILHGTGARGISS